jgi:Asp-tRNA(Asn)/Glu-tRNA(Gln) amidotransferase A subunit family amidase
MARNVADAAFFAGIVSGRPALREITMPDPPPSFGLYRTPMWDDAEPAVAAAIEHTRAALARAGAWVADAAVPDGHRKLTGAQETIMGFELARNLAYERIERSAELSKPLARMIEEGMSVGLADYEAAVALTAKARASLDAFFGPCDALLVPAAPGEAPAGLGYTGNPVFNRMWTLLGTPCVTMPALWGRDGLPTGIQLIGRVGDDERLMRAALFAERALADAQ